MASVINARKGLNEKLNSSSMRLNLVLEFSFSLYDAFNKNKLYSNLPDMVFEEKMESPFD